MDIIRENKDWILLEWSKRVREFIPASQKQGRLALYDSLPDFIDNLATQLDPPTEDDHELSLEKENLIGKVHGQHRANNEYSIDQMLNEYFVLKDVIYDLLESKGQLDHSTRTAISNSFQRALQVSAAQFSRSLLDSQEEFVLALAHDLRNPLMAIRVQTEVMKKRATYDEKSADRILKCSDKINQMIEKLLDAIRTSSTVLTEVDCIEFDLFELAQETADSYSDSIEVPIEVKGMSSVVYWNRSSIERALDNLISNALKYGDTSRPITIDVRSDKTNAFLTVHNFGEPIPVEDQLHLFQKFRRSTNGHNKKGWGIGLSYVKSVIEKHRGIVMVNSDENGTTFRFEMPRHLQQSAEKGLQAAKETEPNEHIAPMNA